MFMYTISVLTKKLFSIMLKYKSGEWADTYIKGDKLYKLIFKADSDDSMYNNVIRGSRIQNTLESIAPKVHSVTWVKGRICVCMEYLEGYKPVHDSKCDASKLAEIAELLKSKNICHGDINTGNILVNAEGDVKVIDFDKAQYKLNGSDEDRSLLTRIAGMYS